MSKTDCDLCKPCRVMLLTTQQFMKLGGEQWDHSFLIRVGKRARELHLEILGKEPKKQRPSTMGDTATRSACIPAGSWNRLTGRSGQKRLPRTTGMQYALEPTLSRPD